MHRSKPSTERKPTGLCAGMRGACGGGEDRINVHSDKPPDACVIYVPFNEKDRADQHSQSGLVCAIQCLGSDKQYADQTGKQLGTLLRENILTQQRDDPHSHI